ncbi:MAG TPA: Gfo/Idh/MocA family oxidoreductase [Dongiaceae bacterium]|nr:Gfo/Idh/MocA family oxidoreductase [Dongiaceae bacterium]
MENNNNSPSSDLPRREFIRKTAAAAAAVAGAPLLKTPVYGQNQAPSPGRVIGANDRIVVGIIGTGFGIGCDHFVGLQDKAAENNIVLAAGCDVYSRRRAWMRGETELPYPNANKGKAIGSSESSYKTTPLKDADVYVDYQKLLERKDIDAVLIATHDIKHAPITLDALQAGKHVYCEKPLTRYLDEAFKVYDRVKQTGKIFQVGSQGCSAGGYHKSAELIKAGKIGQLVWAQAWYSRNSKGGEWNYPIEKEATAQNIDWERWLGQVKKRGDFSPEYYHRWRKYFQFCAGPMGDLAPHKLHPVMLATSKPEFPVRVCSIGTRACYPDKTDSNPEREVPEHQQLLAEFPSGYEIIVTCCTTNASTPGTSLFGHLANLDIDATASKVRLTPQRETGDDIDPESLSGLQPEDIRVHEKNWFDCIRSNTAPNADIELAIRVQTVISLAEMSDRLKVTCLFDEQTRKITDGSGKEIAPITYGTLPIS